MDERRHNMDGALFVDDEQGDDEDVRPARPRVRRAEDDEKAEDARRVTQAILDRMDLEARVTIREDDERVVLDIDGPDAGRAIGKKGMTLEALQFLVNKIVNRDPDERRHIVLDSGDYRDRHDSGLVSMAKREAKRAVSSGRPVTLEPMSARDRRVIHMSLAKFPGVSTRSEGEGNDRRLQIIPARGDRGPRDDRGARDERGPREGRARGPGGGGGGRGPRPGGRERSEGAGGGRERSESEARERGPFAGEGRHTEERVREPALLDDRPGRRDVEARGSAREQNVDARGSAREQNVEARGSAREPDHDERAPARDRAPARELDGRARARDDEPDFDRRG